MADLVLHFLYATGTNSDIRTFKVYQASDRSQEEVYRFYHPITGHATGVTTFHRRDAATGTFETAGQIDWTSNHNATVNFGLDQVTIKDLRRAKKTSSRSRRFKAAGTEYKWKIAENGADLVCIETARRKTVAKWTQVEATLRVAARMDTILDRVVVTCLLNQWAKLLGKW